MLSGECRYTIGRTTKKLVSETDIKNGVGSVRVDGILVGGAVWAQPAQLGGVLQPRGRAASARAAAAARARAQDVALRAPRGPQVRPLAAAPELAPRYVSPSHTQRVVLPALHRLYSLLPHCTQEGPRATGRRSRSRCATGRASPRPTSPRR